MNMCNEKTVSNDKTKLWPTARNIITGDDIVNSVERGSVRRHTTAYTIGRSASAVNTLSVNGWRRIRWRAGTFVIGQVVETCGLSKADK